MSMPANFMKTEVDLLVSEIILTPNVAAQLVTQIFELLLFQRNQIPLVFTTFKLIVSKWKDVSTGSSREDLLDSNKFEFQRHRYNALKTFNNIKHCSNMIYHIFKMKKIIKCIRILIGSTPLMPKEIYIINIPNTCYDHYDKIHRQSTDPVVKNLLRTILTSEKLSKIFVNTLKPTNVYVDFQLEASDCFSNYLNLKDVFEYSTNCKQIVFNIENNYFQRKVSLSCCRNFTFCDVKSNLENENEISGRTNISKNFSWFEVNCAIKGFRDNKKYNIWK